MLVLVLAAISSSSAAADDGWTSFGGNASKRTVGPPAGFVNTPADNSPLPDDPAGDDAVVIEVGTLDAGSGIATEAGVVVGPPGPQGPPGPKGDKGDKGDSADLCANLPGVQTSPGWKRWPQRYWTFKPRLERRVLALNRKGQIVCVTLSWVKRHGWRGRR